LVRLRFLAAAAMAGALAANVAAYSPALAADVARADVRGVSDKPLRFAIQQAIGKLPTRPTSRIEARRRAREAEAKAIAVLRSEGYYDYTVTSDIDEGDAPEGYVTVTPGPRTKLAEIQIEWTGAPPDPQTQDAARKAMALKPGDAARAADVIAAEGRLIAIVERLGYADAVAGPREVIVDHADLTMHPTYRISSGSKIRFDGIRLTTRGHTNKSWVTRLVPWKAGQTYMPEQVAELERRLLETGAYDSVTVALAPPAEAVNGERPVVVSLAERPKGTLELGASYSTAEGLGVNSRWLLYNRLGLGDTVTNTFQVAQIDSRLQTELSLPDWRRPLETLKLTAALYRDVADAYNVDGVGISADLTHRYGKTSFLTYGVSLDGTQTDEKEEANFVTTSRIRDLAIFGVLGAFALDRSNDPLNPTRGWRMDARVQPTVALGDGSITYLKSTVQASAYLPLDTAADTVIAGRMRLGTIIGGDIPLVPALDRFYAGGGGSVRGFGYEAVGPRFSDNTAEGGLSLFEGSLEVRRRLTEQWGVVGFIDAGTVGQQVTPDFKQPSVGVGVGVRYNLGFGPIRLDIATPVNPRPGDPNVQVYLSIGQSF
jgi:translocation and assembly module TamA